MRALLLLLYFFFLSISFSAFSQQEDSNYIADYSKGNNVELSNLYNSLRLHFITKGKDASTFDFFNNNGLFSGIYLNYKWLSVGYGINVPFTSRDNSVKGFKSYRLHFNSYFHGWGVAGGGDVYKGLLSQIYKGAYTPIEGVKYTNIYADFFWVGNPYRYSYKAAQDLGQQQLQNCGSFVYHIRPYYYALGLQTSPSSGSDSIQNFINGSPRWLSLITSVGYGYNFIWNKGQWIICPRIEAGLGGLYQFGIENKVRASAFFRTALSAGYSTENMYTYINAETINATNFFASTILSDDRLRLSLTAGYRLRSFKKKILGVL